MQALSCDSRYSAGAAMQVQILRKLGVILILLRSAGSTTRRDQASRQDPIRPALPADIVAAIYPEQPQSTVGPVGRGAPAPSPAPLAVIPFPP
jgi:hypothetical protein